tara:strand:- start:479 stop:724 length:246 start_codon:yes stop_codon:yes gene_type:complete
MVSMYRRVMRMIPATRRTRTGGAKGRMKPSGTVGLAAKEREAQARILMRESRKKGRRKTKTGGALGTTRPRTTRRTGGGGR